MPVRRHLPLRNPDLAQLKTQAKELFRAIRSGEPDAIAELKRVFPDASDPSSIKLADAQLVLARSYGKPSWTRLVRQVKVVNAVERDDLDAVKKIANGDKVLFTIALDRSILAGNRALGNELYGLAGRPVPPDTILTATAGPLNVEGTEFLFDIGARVRDDAGNLVAPVSILLTTVARNPTKKHRLLEMFVDKGVVLPDTAVMAMHRGRIDLLKKHVDSEPALLSRTFSYGEIFPVELGCTDKVGNTLATPLEGATLLHIAVEFGETELVKWLLDNGMDVNVRASKNERGFGGQTALFHTTVAHPSFWNQPNRPGHSAVIAELLLSMGIDPQIRASMWTDLEYSPMEPPGREFPDVTAKEWAEAFPWPNFVNREALKLLE